MRLPEAARLREQADALQSVLAQQEKRNALYDEFLDLFTIHGESHPGERKLARAFLERGEVGTLCGEERKPWWQCVQLKLPQSSYGRLERGKLAPTAVSGMV
jgi:hypothetical protein